MAFNPQGNKSLTLVVTSSGQSIDITGSSPQCRVYNEGPNACRLVYGTTGVTAADDDLVMPGGFCEVHTKSTLTVLAAKAKTSETATLHIICGQGD